ncbi:MAG TPA: M20/M25/M40 family metallo-hydrolase [Luteitalea sp.]|nr:M20/M25/M40 family metallo-hydrolase [Luteitalea sp.]
MNRVFAIGASTVLGATLTAVVSVSTVSAQPSASSVADEALRHFQAILRLDTQNPPGNEVRVVEYLEGVLKGEQIETQRLARDPARPNLVARLRGTGRKRPLLIMGHTDVVTVDAAKWTHPPFSATRAGGHIYGRGSLDDKPSVTAALMTMLQLKRSGIPLDRDVIFLAEASEEGNGPFGINYMVTEQWGAIDAEYCIAEGGGVVREGGRVRFAAVTATEKIPHTIQMVARGVAGHGSVPLLTNPIVHLSQAIAKIAAWRRPMRLNETTRAYFEGLARMAPHDEAARYRAIVEGRNVEAAQDHFAANSPLLHSLLRTSISPNIVKGGYLRNVIPSEAEATLDIRAVPDEDMPRFLDQLRAVIADPAISLEPATTGNGRPAAPPSRLDTEAYKVIEAVNKRVYGVDSLPTMLAGATDMAQVRSKGVQCYGIGPMTDREDAALGYGAHSDQERILEEAFQSFVRAHFEIVRDLSATTQP